MKFDLDWRVKNVKIESSIDINLITFCFYFINDEQSAIQLKHYEIHQFYINNAQKCYAVITVLQLSLSECDSNQ